MGFLTPTATGELDVLRTYAMQQLAQVRTTVHGLTDEQVRAIPTASALNLDTLLRHCGQVAVYWSACAASAPALPELPADMRDEQSLAEMVADPLSARDSLAFFDRCVALTTANLAAVTDLAAPVPVPEAPWFPSDLESWEARWVLLHIATEVARHTGHADIIRETLDGRGAYELNDLADAGA